MKYLGYARQNWLPITALAIIIFTIYFFVGCGEEKVSLPVLPDTVKIEYNHEAAILPPFAVDLSNDEWTAEVLYIATNLDPQSVLISLYPAVLADFSVLDSAEHLMYRQEYTFSFDDENSVSGVFFKNSQTTLLETDNEHVWFCRLQYPKDCDQSFTIIATRK